MYVYIKFQLNNIYSACTHPPYRKAHPSEPKRISYLFVITWTHRLDCIPTYIDVFIRKARSSKDEEVKKETDSFHT